MPTVSDGNALAYGPSAHGPRLDHLLRAIRRDDHIMFLALLVLDDDRLDVQSLFDDGERDVAILTLASSSKADGLAVGDVSEGFVFRHVLIVQLFETRGRSR